LQPCGAILQSAFDTAHGFFAVNFQEDKHTIKGLFERLAAPSELAALQVAVWRALSKNIGDIIEDNSDTYIKSIERESDLSCPRALHGKEPWMKLGAHFHEPRPSVHCRGINCGF